MAKAKKRVTRSQLEKAFSAAFADNNRKMTPIEKSLIRDYLDYNDTKNELMDDCIRNGPRLTVTASTGAPIVKDNKSYQLLYNATRTMLSILKSLNIQPEEIPGGDDDGIM